MKLPSFSLKTLPRSWLVLGAALLIGLLAAMAARHFLAQQMQALDTREKVSTVDQVVAKQALRKGDVINSDTVAVRQVPTEFAHETALTPSDFERYSGSTLAHPVRGGETLVLGMLESQRPPTFSTRVVQGRRAITFPVDEINSISGMLEPGDQIDLLLTLDLNGRTRHLTIVQRLSVLATGQRVVDDGASGDKRQYSTVTVDTSIEDAQIIIAARGKGKLSALLRNPKDLQAIPSNKAEILAALGMSTRSSASPIRKILPMETEIPVLYGGRSNSNLANSANNAADTSNTSNGSNAIQAALNLPTLAPPGLPRINDSATSGINPNRGPIRNTIIETTSTP